MYSSRTSHPIKLRQRGAALMIMLVIMVMGVAAFFVSTLSSSALRVKQDEVTADALAQAKEALIGYAATYADNPAHPNETYGYLPCPANSGLNEGQALPGCGSQNVSQIGRLPWKTLGLPPLRDASGECLWYAVSGTYKNSPKTDLMNWDNNGQFQVLSASGVISTGQTADSNAAAVIFAPGPALGNLGQNRSPDGLAPICGGNYTASNYLDNDFAITADNAAPSTIANAISQFFSTGATTNINDRIIFITRSDIFNAIKKRKAFQDFVNNGLASITTPSTCLALHPPVTLNFNNSPPTETAGITMGSLIRGRVPNACIPAPSSIQVPFGNWKDNLLYARCTSTAGSGCLNVNGATCSGVVIFSGERAGAQIRTTDAEKNTWSNYLEDIPLNANLTTFTTGGSTFKGASTYLPASPSSDIFVCIP